MAKKGKITTEEVVRKIASAYDKRHLKNLNAIKKAIDALYDELAKEAARIGEATGFNDPASPFVLSEHPQAEKRIDELLSKMGQKMQIVVERGDKSEWLLAAEKNARLIDELMKSTGISKSIIEKWKEPNLSALKAFQKRKAGGMNLSQRVWRIKDQAKQELELALDIGLGEGKSAAELSRDVRKYLDEPKKLFRRVRDKHGVLHLSKRAAAYHPGQGVYRSSYRNAIRMTATETNIAYHTSDYHQWQSIPLIKGVRIELSNNHTIVNNKGQRVPFWDICDELQGDYPKPFKFPGWHPFCRCIAVPIVASWDEIEEMWQAEDRGEDISDYHFKDEVRDMPDAFVGWMKKNEDRIEKAKSMPYFIKDNYKDGDVKKGLRWADEQKKTGKSDDELYKLAKAVGVEVGEPMAHEQADMKHPNPYYGEDEQYRINCQSCVVTYELRRRGLPVEAFGNVDGSMGGQLAYNTRAAWLDVDGNMPKPIRCFQLPIDWRSGRWILTTEKEVLAEFEKKTAEPGRYHISWMWKKHRGQNKYSGHIITMEVFADGTRRYYDPQTGIESASINKWMMDGRRVRFDLKKASLRAYRVDNLRPNPLIVKGVVKKAGSGLATPMMTAEQKEWWKKTVEKKTSDTSNVSSVLSPKGEAASNLINWFTQNAPLTKVGKDTAKRFEVISTDDKKIIINKNFYKEVISKYKSDELYIEKLQYAQKAHEYLPKATLVQSEAGRHCEEDFRVYVYKGTKYNIEFKVKEGQDGDFLYVMRLYKK
nr:MAG TPA: Papain fold toxin 1, glutamine deamidase [Caudoviricetes sp.]